MRCAPGQVPDVALTVLALDAAGRPLAQCVPRTPISILGSALYQTADFGGPTMKLVIGLSIAALATLVAQPVRAQGVDYHKSQQAGKVWGDKIDENNRREAKSRNARRNSEGVRYDAPLTQRDRADAMAAERAEYQKLYDSVGKKNADRWLDFKARAMRARR